MVRRHLTLLAGLLALLLGSGLRPALAQDSPDVSGEWEMTAETPAGSFTSTLKLERAGETLSGTMTSRNGEPRKLTNLKLAGKTLTFERDISFNGMDLHLVYTGTVDGDTIKGTFEANGQKMDWSAKRRAAPAAAVPVSTTPITPGQVAGTWILTIETQNGTREQTLVLKQEGDKLTGTVTGFGDQVNPLQNVSIQGHQLRYTTAVERNGQTFRRTSVVTFAGDMLKGTTEGRSGNRPFTGRRQAAPAQVATAGIAGSWKLTVQAPEQTYHPTLVLVQQDGKWSGKLVRDDGMEDTLKQVTVNGSQLQFVVDLDIDGNVLHLEFKGTIEGANLKGAIDANGMSLPTTGQRAPQA